MTMSCPSQRLTVQAEVTQTFPHIVHAAISTTAKKNCQQCQNKGGCQSLSIYQLFFANRPMILPNKGYHQGQQLTIDFPATLIQQSIGLLLGLPLTGFIIGVLLGGSQHELTGFGIGIVLGLAAYFMSQRLTRRRLLHKVIVS